MTLSAVIVVLLAALFGGATVAGREGLKMLAATIKARWVCEQAHQQLKEELGLDHFEGRSWTGLHRHALMTMIAYAFLQSRRLRAAGRKKKSRGTTATTEYAGHQASHPRSLRTASPQAMPPL
jgi:SRSO17 transposase